MLQVSKKHRFFGKNGALLPVSVCTFSDFDFISMVCGLCKKILHKILSLGIMQGEALLRKLSYGASFTLL